MRKGVATEGVGLFSKLGSVATTLILLVLTLQLSSCKTIPAVKAGGGLDEAEAVARERKELEETWGIEIVGLRLSAVGYMLDFRYKVVDPEKAAPLLSRKVKPFLIEEKTGAKVIVPKPAKIGPLRHTVKHGKPQAGRIYMIIFANPGSAIKEGSEVTVAIGDFKAKNLTVE